jgi:hypothetical protein
VNRLAALAVLATLAVLLPFAFVYLFASPSAERDWSPDQRLLPRATTAGERVTIVNLRNFSYKSTSEYAARYETRSYDLRRLDSAWFIVERFGDAPAIAHTFLSFGFGDEYVAISVETRRERGETYSPLKGLLRQYELMYVIGDERDLIGLRTNFRRDRVYLYPVRAAPEKLRQLFVGMLERSNQLAGAPEFYNTLTNNCTTNIVRHVNAIAPRIRFSFKKLLPTYSDSLAYDLGLIPTDRPFKAVQAAHRIDPLAQRRDIGPEFSRLIRGKEGPQEISAARRLCSCASPGWPRRSARRASSRCAERVSSKDRLASRKLCALPQSSACAQRRPRLARSGASRARSRSQFSPLSMRTRASACRPSASIPAGSSA